MKAKNLFLLLTLIVVVFTVGGYAGYILHKKRHQKVLYNPCVEIVHTNLPILSIDIDETITKEHPVFGRMSITNSIAKDCDSLNSIDYSGRIEVKLTGNSSLGAPKKSYIIKNVDNYGDKIKVSLLGLKASTKYALRSSYYDRSFIRDGLTFELARPYFDWTPSFRFCEVLLNGQYIGVYLLEEKPTRSLIGIPKLKKDITGGYLLRIDRPREGSYMSRNLPTLRDGSMIRDSIAYTFEYPDAEEINPDQKKYICQRIDEMETAILKGRGYTDLIDLNSFVSYVLITEFSRNDDGYALSTYLYKDKDEIDGRFKMTLWDLDCTYGNVNTFEGCYSPEGWQYLATDEIYDHRQKYLIPSWWPALIQSPDFQKAMKMQWRQWRQKQFSYDHIEHVIDSLANIITEGGSERRNSEAWLEWYKERYPLKYNSFNYTDEILYLKSWIRRRLEWMDQQLLEEK